MNTQPLAQPPIARSTSLARLFARAGLALAASFFFACPCATAYTPAAALHQPSTPPTPSTAIPSATTPAPATKDLTSLLEPIREKYKLPALAAAVVTTDGLDSLGATGLRAAGRPEKVTPADQFHLGSCTKAMTATLLAVLVEEGALKWETTLPQALPDLANSIHEKYRAVTLADLLTQRSGVPTDLNRDGLWASMWRGEGDIIAQRHHVAKVLLGWGPDHDREKFVYSNANFILAGHIAEVATGRSWEDLIREKLFEPLGMSSAGFGAPGDEGAFNQPQGHRADGTSVGVGPGSDNPASLGPAGTVHASLEDWGKFISLHLRGEKAARDNSDFKLGSVTMHGATFRKLHEPVKGNGADYAMGWGVAQRPWAKGPGGSGLAITHNGSNTMWFCVVWAAPETGFAVLAATNTGAPQAAKALDDVAAALIQSHK